VIDPATGKNITTEGRGAVAADPEGADFPWYPKALSSVESASGTLNSSACLVYNDSNLKDDIIAMMNKVATSHWDQWKSEGKEPLLHFFYGKGGDLASRVLEFTNVKTDPALLILDIPSGTKYICQLNGPLTEGDFCTFVNSWKDGKLESLPLRS